MMAEGTTTRGSGRLGAARVHSRAPAADANLLWQRIGWIALAGAWVFLTASAMGFDGADAPAPGVYPHNDPALNWCGRFGAVVAYYAFEMFGWGVWVLLALLALLLAITATGRRVGHVWVRLVGAVLMAASLAGVQALVLPGSGPVRGLGGGLIGTLGVAELSSRFNTLGTFLCLVAAIMVAAVVTLDAWALVAAIWTARLMLVAGRHGGRLAGRMGGRMVTMARRHGASARLNDVDDDESLPGRSAATVEAKGRARRGMRLEDQTIGQDPRSGVGPGATDAFDPDAMMADRTARAGPTSADDETGPGASNDDDDTPGAPQVFDPEALRLKMARLPVRFASLDAQSATDDDLRDIQNVSELEGYRFPGLDLLEEPQGDYSETMNQYVREQAGALERALKEYRIDGEVVGIDSGPVITLYEVRLAPGTKVSVLSAVASDLARALKAVNIRVVPNTAGRDTVGVEVPNSHKEKVRLKELMNKMDTSVKMRLPMFLGKDASGQPLIEDLTQIPHLLIAGTTGSGKSVCMNTIIMSFLYTKKPNELKLVLVDPKMVELSQFKDIPHLMCPVVTEMGKATAILEWAVGKMDERYELLSEAGCRDIAAYNELPWPELKQRFNPASEQEEARIPRKLPYMVFVIDELADLMMTNKEVEHSVVRIAQKARAVGIHMIIATQRPQANVVTGLIKSNMPGRISFKVASGMDSRIVLDQKGGELLLGQGDMLYLSPRNHKLMRAQGTLVDDKEIRRVVRFMRDVAAPTFERQLMQLRSGGGPSDEEAHDGFISAQADPMFDEAVEIVLETRRGSVSMLQRRLAIGYTRAARLIEMMGEAGILGSHKGTVAREVTMTLEEWHAMKAQAAADARANQAAEGTGAPGTAADQDLFGASGGASTAESVPGGNAGAAGPGMAAARRAPTSLAAALEGNGDGLEGAFEHSESEDETADAESDRSDDA